MSDEVLKITLILASQETRKLLFVPIRIEPSGDIYVEGRAYIDRMQGQFFSNGTNNSNIFKNHVLTVDAEDGKVTLISMTDYKKFISL